MPTALGEGATGFCRQLSNDDSAGRRENWATRSCVYKTATGAGISASGFQHGRGGIGPKRTPEVVLQRG